MCTQIIIFFSWYSIVPKASNFCNNNIMVQILKDLLSNSKNIPSVSYALVLATISYCFDSFVYSVCFTVQENVHNQQRND